ncbi:MAG: signal peptidase I [Candidatus Nomurabacteria bacterium]|jgi:signal peptidase I|nr:signal peptidase I [Candidatus Nomurabacteria bacterium]
METVSTPSFLQRHPVLKDTIGLIGFILAVVAGTIILNSFVFRSYNVVGSSMENTLRSDDRIIVNRVPVTLAHLQNKEYVPKRGQIIVFTNPNHNSIEKNQYIIKRVIAFEGERVTVRDGVLTVYNDEHKNGFHPDDETRKSDSEGPKQHTKGDIDVTVPEGEIFVSGDNRENDNSYDSRNGLGTIPLYDVVGPASFRFFPFNQIRFF